MINKTVVYYMCLCVVGIIIYNLFINNAVIAAKYNERMTNIGSAIYDSTYKTTNDSSIDSNEIFNILDNDLQKIYNMVDSIINYKNNIFELLSIDLYKDKIKTEISMNLNSFVLIKTLILDRYMLLDNGVVAYFKYTFKKVPNKEKFEIFYDSDYKEIKYYDDINNIESLILEKELFLDNGAIFYFAYNFKNKE